MAYYSRTVTTHDGGRTTTHTYTSGGSGNFNPGFSLFGPGGKLNFNLGGSDISDRFLHSRGGIRHRPTPIPSSRFSGIGDGSSGFSARSSGMGYRPVPHRPPPPKFSGGSGPKTPSTNSTSKTSVPSAPDGITAFNRRSIKPGPPLPMQDFDSIKRECQRTGRLWEDPDFPADFRSISNRRSFDNFEWKRPGELCGNPQFFVGGASRFDVKQGKLGDCWLLAAVASLTMNQELLHRVVPPDQSFTSNYCGAFVFRFWHQGDWLEVVVDDRLPSSRNELVFLQSEEKNEFWSALLEKAYAKLVGNYDNLKGGSTLEAMEDFSGGVGENFNLKQAPRNMFQIMLKAMERGSLMGCAIEAEPSRMEDQLPNGLVLGHAYSVTGVRQMRAHRQLDMVRVRNPWGTAEWNGPWSDKSREWNQVSESERRQMGLDFDDDGEFWMSYSDFSRHFTKLEVCNLGPDSLSEEEAATDRKRFVTHSEHGAWMRRVNAGGCRNFLDTFWTNPQFLVTLTDPDDDDDDDMCTMILALMQKDRRKKRSQGLDFLTIGYCIYQLKDPEQHHGPLDLNFFRYNASAAKSPAFVNTREVCGRHRFLPGTYVVIPSTFDPNEEADFLLRIYTEKSNLTNEMDDETGVEESKPSRTTSQEPEPENTAQTEALRRSFTRLAGDDAEISAYELQPIMDAFFKKDVKFDGFSVETARSMVAMMDVDRSGKLGFDEFKTLWTKLKKWKTAFQEHDKNNSGNLNSYELRQALHEAGFRMSNETLATLVFRYSRKDGSIPFDDFVLCAVRLGHMIDLFRSHEIHKGLAEFSLDDFIQTTMYS